MAAVCYGAADEPGDAADVTLGFFDVEEVRALPKRHLSGTGWFTKASSWRHPHLVWLWFGPAFLPYTPVIVVL